MISWAQRRNIRVEGQSHVVSCGQEQSTGDQPQRGRGQGLDTDPSGKLPIRLAVKLDLPQAVKPNKFRTNEVVENKWGFSPIFSS